MLLSHSEMSKGASLSLKKNKKFFQNPWQSGSVFSCIFEYASSLHHLLYSHGLII